MKITKKLNRNISKATSCENSCRSDKKKVLNIFLSLMMIFILLPSASALTVPSQDFVKSGLSSYGRVTTNAIGDRGSQTSTRFADIDADGDYDMFVGRNNGYTELWRNDGNSTNPVWVSATTDLVGDVGGYSRPALADMDNDGDIDLFVGAQDGHLRYYKNTGSKTSYKFVYQGSIYDIGDHSSLDLVDYNDDGYLDIVYGRNDGYLRILLNDAMNTRLFMDDFEMDDVGSHSSPSYADLDDDGDNDLVVGNSDGRVYFYENIGNSTDAEWAEEKYYFDLGSYATPLLKDFDFDGDFDLFVGLQDGTIVYYQNDGTSKAPFWNLIDGFFTYDVGDYAYPAAGDMDADGDLDLIVGGVSGVSSYYRNDGTAENPDFIFITSGTFADAGDHAAPSIVDLNNDGILDVVIGNLVGDLFYYENVGNSSVFSFGAATSFFTNSYDYLTPTFADMDADGDLDLAFGTGNNQGWVVMRDNVGNVTNPAFEKKNTWWLDNLGNRPSHDMIDFDGDGDLDLIEGNNDGYVRYRKNVGSVEEPNFVYISAWFDIGNQARPTLGDLDNDGDVDLLVGNDGYPINYYENDASETSINFEEKTNYYANIDIGDYATPEFADIDADGDLDMFVGKNNGQIAFYRNVGTADFANYSLVNGNQFGDHGDRVSFSFADIDGDSDLDMIAGYSNNGYVHLFRNNGDETNMSFNHENGNFLGGYCRNGDSNSYVAPRFTDIDSDGDYDIVCSNRYYGPYLWRNDGSADSPNWNPIGDLVGDPGDFSRSDFVDFDGDGDQDMVVSIESNLGRNYYYKNIGTPQSHIFTRIMAGHAGMRWLPELGGNTYPSTTFADIDADGDQDVFIGLVDGRIKFIENKGIYQTKEEQSDHATWISRGNILGSQRCTDYSNGHQCSPDLGDYDNDGDLDLVIGGYYGYVNLFENINNAESFNFQKSTRIRGDGVNYADPSFGDIDGDGDLDIIITDQDANIQLVKNRGTKENPSYTTVYDKSQHYHWYQDVGSYAYVDLFDYDGDGYADMSLSSDNGDFQMIKNRGPYEDKTKAMENPTFVYHTHITELGKIYDHTVPTFGDIDGDGDLDLVVGAYDGHLRQYENIGEIGSPKWKYVGSPLDIGYWSAPGLVDIDADGDLDYFTGENGGYIQYFRNNGNYEIATTVILKDEANAPVFNATVDFKDLTGTVCSKQTDANGRAQCNITYVGDEGSIEVRNTVKGTVDVAISSYNSNGQTKILLDNPSSNFKLEIERMVFETFDKDYNENELSIVVKDQGKTIMKKSSKNGFLDAYFVKSYLKNMQEPFTQNKITYDVTLEKSSDYASTLELNDIYVPNEINISSDSESKKLYKFLASHEMATDALYSGYVIYPALKAQHHFTLNDNVPTDFKFVGNVTIEYNGKSCSVPAENGTTASIGPNDFGCDFLEKAVTSNAEWVKVKYTVESPSLDLFVTNSWNEKEYTMPGAELSLIS